MWKLVIAGVTLIALAGCETVRDAGRDLQSAGRVVERSIP